MPSHTMELPRQIVVGEKNISDIGNFLRSLTETTKASLISGSNVKKIVQRKIEESLIASKIKSSWYLACLLYTSPSPRDKRQSRMPSSA